MKRNVLVLTRCESRKEYDNIDNLLPGLKSFETRNSYEGAIYENLLFVFDGKNLSVKDTLSGRDISDYDALFLTGWFKTKALDDVARSVAHYAASKNIPFANSEAYYGRSFTKLSQCVIAVLNGIKTTPFVFSLNPEATLAYLRDKPINYPCIAKAVAASKGRDNYLVDSIEQLEAILRDEQNPKKFFIVQPYIPNDGDCRILVMNGKVVRVIHREAKAGSHLNNTSQGGTASLLAVSELPQTVIDDSAKIAKLFRREITGVDMIKDKESGDYYFLEVNNMPQLATGSYVREKLVQLDKTLAELDKLV